MCNGQQPFSKKEIEAAKAAKLRTKLLGAKLAAEHNADTHINKLLLLGAGESGKSTLFKQMISLYGEGYPLPQRKIFSPIIHHNLITSIKVLLEHSPNFGNVEYKSTTNFQELQNDTHITGTIAEDIANLWADRGIQMTYEQRAKFQLTDSAAYFFDKVREVACSEYVPSEQDVMRSRARTTGIVESSFAIEGNQFKMYDVGGQRNERRKWIHCFEEVTAVMFVAAISEYDQVLFEDENTNRMEESLNLFEEVSNSCWFKETAILLFLNKRDLFQEKLGKVDLRTCFPEYNGDDSYEEACGYVQGQFESRCRSTGKTIYSHVTCATDTSHVRHVFNSVKDIIVQVGLKQAGLV